MWYFQHETDYAWLHHTYSWLKKILCTEFVGKGKKAAMFASCSIMSEHLDSNYVSNYLSSQCLRPHTYTSVKMYPFHVGCYRKSYLKIYLVMVDYFAWLDLYPCFFLPLRLVIMALALCLPLRPCTHRLFRCGVVTRSDLGQSIDGGIVVLLWRSCAVTSTIIWSGHNVTREQSMDTGFFLFRRGCLPLKVTTMISQLVTIFKTTL